MLALCRGGMRGDIVLELFRGEKIYWHCAGEGLLFSSVVPPPMSPPFMISSHI